MSRVKTAIGGEEVMVSANINRGFSTYQAKDGIIEKQDVIECEIDTGEKVEVLLEQYGNVKQKIRIPKFGLSSEGMAVCINTEGISDFVSIGEQYKIEDFEINTNDELVLILEMFNFDMPISHFRSPSWFKKGEGDND